MDTTNASWWTYDVLNSFNKSYYNNIIYYDHLQEEDFLEEGSKNKPEPRSVWVFNYNKRKYLLDTDYENQLPIKVNEVEQIIHRTRPHYLITNLDPIKIKQERCLSFRDLIDGFMAVQHTQPEDFFLYRIIALASYIGRVNVRVSSEPAFGKDGVFKAIKYLTNKCAVTKARTFPKLEFNLRNDIVVLPELSNIQTGQISLYQDFLLTVGDFSTSYDKGSLANTKFKTYNSYDISNLSLVVTFNDYKNYVANQTEMKYFDRMFQPAVLNRFLPLRLRGNINVSQFDLHSSYVKETMDNARTHYIQTLRTMEWYKHNYFKELDCLLMDSITLDKYPMTERQFKSFYLICEMLNLYSQDKTEFLDLVNHLYDRFKDYDLMFAERDDPTQAVVEEFIR